MVTNKKLGNTFETEFCEILFDNGFWCHNMAQNQAGQPADVIAVRNKAPHLIDCKVCSDGKFPLSRIEENQHYAMELWKKSGNGEGWFALKIEGQIMMIPHFTMTVLAKEKSVLSMSEIMECGFTLERWIEQCK